MTALLVAFLAAAYWLRVVLGGYLALRRIPALASCSASNADKAPSVSVVLAARNEGNSIRDCLESLLQQDMANFEVIAVNDRSEDETGALMDELSAASGGRLKVVHISALPDGWLGKCHALASGAKAAQGECLLFTDGDVIFAPDAVRAAVIHLKTTNADMMVAVPRLIGGSALEQSMLLVFVQTFTAHFRLFAINADDPKAFVGVGAFNMIRRSTYEHIGGHEPLRLQVVDDVGLGQLVRQNGGRIRVVFGEDKVRVRWQDSVWGLITGLEKNAFASMGYSWPRAFVGCAALLTAYCGPVAGLFWGGLAARVLSGATLAGLMIPASLFTARKTRLQWYSALLAPLGTVCFVVAIIRSTVLTLYRKGIRWRGTHYDLADLKDYTL